MSGQVNAVRADVLTGSKTVSIKMLTGTLTHNTCMYMYVHVYTCTHVYTCIICTSIIYMYTVYIHYICPFIPLLVHVLQLHVHVHVQAVK